MWTEDHRKELDRLVQAAIEASVLYYSTHAGIDRDWVGADEMQQLEKAMHDTEEALKKYILELPGVPHSEEWGEDPNWCKGCNPDNCCGCVPDVPYNSRPEDIEEVDDTIDWDIDDYDPDYWADFDYWNEYDSSLDDKDDYDWDGDW